MYNEAGFSPQPYEQLATVYRRTGRDDAARKVLIAKQRRRRGQLNRPGRLWNILLYWTVGYGYRTWQAGLWLLLLLTVGTAIFTVSYPSDFRATTAEKVQPAFQPFLYAVDVLLPVLNLHQRDAWTATGPMEWLVAAFTVLGWILGTAAVLSLTGILKRSE
jgi:hypothetical protein